MNTPRTTKDGRIHWLTNIPSRWKVVPSTCLFSSSSERAREGDQQLSATQAYGVIPQAKFEKLEGRRVVHVTQHLDRRKHVELDDFIISMRSFEGGLERAWATGCIRSSYVVLKPSDAVNPSYFQYLFKSTAYIQALQATSNYIRDGQDLNFENFRLVNLPLVPLEEQRAIANSLDQKTAAVDELIAKKERLIELLEEKRAALINRAVTRGLDPDVPLKDSGVPWIGEIPEHWGRAPVYALFRVELGKMLNKAASNGPNQKPYLGNQNTQWDRVDLDDVSTMSFSPAEQRQYRLRHGDLLVCEGGDIGRTAVWRGELDECYFQKALHRLRPIREALVPRYFFYVMFTASDVGAFEAEGSKSTIIHLTKEKLRAMRFPKPPLSEQLQIVETLDEQTQQLEKVAALIKSEIGRLSEYRQSLITAAVTGQIDIEGESASEAVYGVAERSLVPVSE